MDFSVAELQRRLYNVVRYGRVVAADYQAARVKVKSGQVTTAWLPWATGRAGNDRSWWAPEIGETVILFAPEGELTMGVVMPAIYSTTHPAPANRPTLMNIEMGDGAVFSYDRDSHHLAITLPEGATMSVTAPGGTEWHGPITHHGDMTRQGSYSQTGGSMAHDGKNVGADHVHAGVQSGSSKTKGPQ